MQPDLHNANTLLDDTDRLLIAELSINGRASASALADSIGLTRQAATSRMDRLKNEGIIQHYTVALDPDKIQLPVRAFVSITLMPVCSQQAEDEVIALLRLNPYVQECYRVTGDDYFQVRVVAPNLAVIREIVVALRATGVVQGTSTVLALETMFEKSYLRYETQMRCDRVGGAE